jgi:putative N6-adenine-specific DNA methylase
VSLDLFDLFAVVAPGLEATCAAELAALGVPARALPGGVAFTGDATALALANLRLATATRVLVRLGEFHAAAFSELHSRAARLPWEQYFAGPPRVAVQAAAHKSRLHHTGGIRERIIKGMTERLGCEPEQAAADDDADATAEVTRVVVRLDRDRCTVSVDSSGDPLHRRGYRLAIARAPLRPTLAAGVLRLAGWSPHEPLLDPLCGSGTLVIEAARVACAIPPGSDRSFLFERWPGLRGADALAQVRRDLSPETAAPAPLAGSDRDPGAISAARANAERARVAAAVRLDHRPLSACEPPPGVGLVVANPPYGIRVGKRGPLRDLFAQLGHVLRARCPGWRVALLCEGDLWRHTDLPLAATHALRNGGIAVDLIQGRVPAG